MKARPDLMLETMFSHMVLAIVADECSKLAEADRAYDLARELGRLAARFSGVAVDLDSAVRLMA